MSYAVIFKNPSITVTLLTNYQNHTIVAHIREEGIRLIGEEVRWRVRRRDQMRHRIMGHP